MQSIDIDDLVKQILSDLVSPVPQATVAPSGVTPQKPVPQRDVEDSSKQKTSVIRIDAQVITLAQINEVSAGQGGAIDRIVVPQKAVITPSVRDELRKRNITIEFDTLVSATLPAVSNTNIAVKLAVPDPGTLHVWLALHALKQEPKPLIEFLSRQYTLRQESFQCILKTMQAACEQLDFSTKPTSCVVLSTASAAALCVANRQGDTIRAVLGHDPATLKTDADQIGANLLVVDPERSGIFKTQNLVKMFLSDGVRKIPNFLV